MTTSIWTHTLCRPCWHELNGICMPATLAEKKRKRERCCRCGVFQRDGIYFRCDPKVLTCKGTHGIHEEQESETDASSKQVS